MILNKESALLVFNDTAMAPHGQSNATHGTPCLKASKSTKAKPSKRMT